MSEERLVVDTSVCIDLFNGGILHEVLRLPYEYLLPDVIISELEDPPGSAFTSAGFLRSETSGVQMQLVEELSKDHRQPSTKDIFALATAVREGLALLTGDAELRKAAKEEKVEVHGVVWILDRLIAESILSRAAAADALEKMLAEGAWLPKKECEARLKKWRS